MTYSNLMRNAAKILFAISVIVFFGGLVFALVTVGPRGEFGGFLVGVIGAFSTAIPPFAAAAILWRLDIWLFERSDRA